MNLRNEICAIGGDLAVLKILLSKKYVPKKESMKVLHRIEKVLEGVEDKMIKTRQVSMDEDLPIGAKVMHNTTKEIGTVVGDCLGYGKIKVDFGDGLEYPQPKNNISLIIWKVE